MVLTRRHMISGAAASMAVSQVPTAVFARWEPSERYPDPAVEIGPETGGQSSPEVRVSRPQSAPAAVF